MYCPGIIERRHNVRFPVAIAMENQTHPYGLKSLWAGAGAKYSWKGVCGCATEVTQLENRDREICYCSGRDGGKVLMKWHSLFCPGCFLRRRKITAVIPKAYDPLASILFIKSNTKNFQTKYHIRSSARSAG
ncbi:MAG: hypothetical protein IPN69_00005, partial [Acidobacteria bacterium]|nr:hypothetical protein [Acidobacteriota bacterium]